MRATAAAAATLSLALATTAVNAAAIQIAARDGTSHTIVSRAKGQCLDIANGSTDNGSVTQGWECWASGNTAQEWVALERGNGLAMLQNPHSGRCLTIADGSTQDGAVAYISDCVGSPQQLVRYPNPAGDLSFQHSDKCLDIDQNTGFAHQWKCLGTANQKFDFKPWNSGTVVGGKKPFFGLAYSDAGSLEQAVRELTFLSKYTHAIRTYDAQSSQLALQAIAQANLDMKVLVNIYANGRDDGNIKWQQDIIVDSAKKYGNNIYGVSVDNEPSLNNFPHSKVLSLVASTRQRLSSEANWHGTVSVVDVVTGWLSFNGDFSRSSPTDLLQNLDQVWVDAYPIYAGMNVNSGAAIDYLKTVVEKQFGSQCNGGTCMNGKPRLVITETGHPSAGGCGGCGSSNSGINEMNTYLQQSLCYAAKAGVGLFYFQSFDKPAGQADPGNIEAHFGVFDRNTLAPKQGINDLRQTLPADCWV
ncbi:hypothetical protein HDU88_004956 [Geranomyces variabilis]|nr:hypothetical protein HDU88_004956 [Geranomyces variabilis]